MSLFTDKAPGIMRDLMRDFGLDDLSAAAIVGNLGHESGGFRFLQEKQPLIPGSKGGYGWAQWTGPRRRQYEAYCKARSVDPASDTANYGFLCVELTGSEKAAIPAVKDAKEVKDANGNITKSRLASKVEAFERAFERAGIKHYPSRNNYTAQALKAYHASQPSNSEKTKVSTIAAAGVAGTTGAAVAAGQGISTMEIMAWIGGLVLLGALAYGAYYWWTHRSPEKAVETPDEPEALIEHFRQLREPETPADPVKRKATKKPRTVYQATAKFRVSEETKKRKKRAKKATRR